MKNFKLSQLEWTVYINRRDVGFPNYYWSARSDEIKMDANVVFPSGSIAESAWKRFAKSEGIKSMKIYSLKDTPKDIPVIKKPKEGKSEKSSIFELTGQKIMDKVFELTGEKMTLSPKSKTSIIKKAKQILTEKGIQI